MFEILQHTGMFYYSDTNQQRAEMNILDSLFSGCV